MTSARSWPKAIGFSIPALLLWGLTALFLWAGLANTWYGWVSLDWPVAEGHILRTDIEEVRSNKQDTGDANTTTNWKPGGQIIRYRPIIEYQWQVDGGIYERNRIDFSAAKANEDTREAAEAIIAPYPVGSAVDIHYDPNKPSRGILQPGAHWDGLGVTLIAAFVLAVFALVFSVLAFRSLRK